MQRGPSAEIDLGSVRHNLRAVKSVTGGVPVIAVVKADAYGHGAAEVSKALEAEGVFALAVAFVSEAVSLREAGIKSPLIVLFDPSEPEKYFEHSLVPVVNSTKEAELFSREAQRRCVRIGVHVKADTGMGRMGLCAVPDGVRGAAEVLSIASLGGIDVLGLMSHFAEVNPSDLSYARLQLERFRALAGAVREKGLRPFCHMASSGSALILPDSRLDGVRAGLVLYGGLPFGGIDEPARFGLKPVMKVKTKVTALKRHPKGTPISYDRTFVTGRDSLVAILPVGYADGYMRALSGRGWMVVRGKRAPVAGRVCMDLTMLDVTDVEGVSEGDDVTILGEGLSACELSEWAGTNAYEVMTSLGAGARRSFIG